MKTPRLRLLTAAAVLLSLTTACSAPGAIHAGAVDTHALSSHHPAVTAPAPAAASVPAPATGPVAGTVKQVHSPGIVATDEQLAAGQCSVRVIDAAAGLYLPDPSCTPGAVDPSVTAANLDSTICKSGYTSTVRPSSSNTRKLKGESLREYGQDAVHTTEYDHLISLELGGTNSVSNLWPEPNRSIATGTTNPKDAVEGTLHRAVCNHKVTLSAAQNAISHNWVTAVNDLGL